MIQTFYLHDETFMGNSVVLYIAQRDGNDSTEILNLSHIFFFFLRFLGESAKENFIIEGKLKCLGRGQA